MTSSPFSPRSPLAHSIAEVFTASLVILAVVVAVVVALVTYAIVRYRARPGESGEPSQRPPPRWPEYAWTAGPVLVVVVLFALMVVGVRGSDPPAAGRAPDVVIVGHQWWWEYRYPAEGIVTANELHLPAGRRLLARLESADVIHDFWVPQLGRKMDITPGYPTRLWLEADAPGVYLGTCSEYCGTEHAWMRIRVVAEDDAHWRAWVAAQRAAPHAPVAAAQAGARLFEQRSCSACHAYGGAGARIAPDLTHLPSRATLAAGAVENGRDALARWLADPQAMKPGTLMPNLHLGDQEIRDLVEFLWRP